MQGALRSTGALALATMTLGLGACGSSDDDGGGKALARPALTTKVNAICATAMSAAQKVKQPADIQDSKAAAAYFDAIVPITDKETADITALKADDEAKPDFSAFVTAQTDARDLLRTIRDKADKADASGLDDLKKVAPVSQKVVATAKKLGADTCAQ